MPVHELPPLRLEVVDARSPHTRLWNEYMARHHELGFTPMSGTLMRYAVFAGEQWLALLSFGASAWKLAARDRHRGTCYKAANWVQLGQTVGRGKKAPTHKQILPIKSVWIYPLRRDYLTALTA